MELIADPTTEEEQVFRSAKELISKIRKATSEKPQNPEKAIDILCNLRKAGYEDLNQIQHKAMILRAVRSLQETDLSGKDVEWSWHPGAEGGSEEPDLRGIISGQVVISAEITASGAKKHIMDKDMKETLTKLSRMPGRKIYFVITDEMEKRANTKVNKLGYAIEVRRV